MNTLTVAPQPCESWTHTPMYVWARRRISEPADPASQPIGLEWCERLNEACHNYLEWNGCCGALPMIEGCEHLDGHCRFQWQGARYQLSDRVSVHVFCHPLTEGDPGYDAAVKKYHELSRMCPRYLAERLQKAMTEIITLDKSVENARSMIANAQGEMSRAIAYAKAITILGEALESEKDTIMVLQNNENGFRTDNKDGYPWSIVKSCAVTALIRGFHLTMNEMNIIAGRFYGAQAGYVRIVREFPGFSDDVCQLSVPVVATEEVALVGGYMTWNLYGKPMRRDFLKVTDGPNAGDYRLSCRVNKGMNADGILGKAKRKAYAKVLEQLSGIKFVDAIDQDDKDDPNTVDGKVVSQAATPAITNQTTPAPTSATSATPGPAEELKKHEKDWLESCRAGFEQAANLHEINAIVEDTRKRKPPMLDRVEAMAVEARKRYGSNAGKRETQTA